MQKEGLVYWVHVYPGGDSRKGCEKYGPFESMWEALGWMEENGYSTANSQNSAVIVSAPKKEHS